MRHRKPIFIPLIILVAIGVLSYLVMMLWNHVLVPVLEINPVDYWQAVGIFILSKILFGFRPFGGPPGGMRSKMSRWRNMSPEEKAHFKERWKRHWKHGKEENEKS